MEPERPLFLLGPIAATLRWLEELANLLSGPLLALGAIIAVIDLTTDGRLTATYPLLLYLFAVSQAVGVEMQLTGAWDRARHALAHRRWGALLGQALLGLLLGGIVYVGLYAYLGEQSFHLTTAQALTALGVSDHFWLFLRAGIAIFLVALSAWTRYRAPRQTALADERAKLERELELEPLRQRLRHTRLAGVRDAATALVNGETRPATLAVEPSTDQDTPLATHAEAETASRTPDDTTDVQPLTETPAPSQRDESPIDEPADEPEPEPPSPEPPDPFPAKRRRSPGQGRKPIELQQMRTRTRRTALEAQAFAALDADPSMTVDELRRVLGCAKRVASELRNTWRIAGRDQRQRAERTTQQA